MARKGATGNGKDLEKLGLNATEVITASGKVKGAGETGAAYNSGSTHRPAALPKTLVELKNEAGGAKKDNGTEPSI